MKLRTEIDFQKKIDDDLSWRIREMGILKKSVHGPTDLKKEAFARAAIAVIYAHWEGFVKNSAECYINFVANQRCSYAEIQPCFRVFGVKERINALVETSRLEKAIDALSFLISGLNGRARISFSESVDTQSNLNSTVFKGIVLSIGLDYSHYETHEKFIDIEILKQRNDVAHGESIFIAPSDVPSLIDELIGLMRKFKDDLELSVTNKLYKLES